MSRFVALLLLVVVLAPGCAGGSAEVEIDGGQRFEPAELTISGGETITFRNTSSEPHTVTAYQNEMPEGAAYFSSGGLSSEESARDELADALVAAGETYELTLVEPGTYRYFCIPHEEAGMKGTIVVEG